MIIIMNLMILISYIYLSLYTSLFVHELGHSLAYICFGRKVKLFIGCIPNDNDNDHNDKSNFRIRIGIKPWLGLTFAHGKVNTLQRILGLSAGPLAGILYSMFIKMIYNNSLSDKGLESIIMNMLFDGLISTNLFNFFPAKESHGTSDGYQILREIGVSEEFLEIILLIFNPITMITLSAISFYPSFSIAYNSVGI